jgi:PAS domain S-box-containing protein
MNSQKSSCLNEESICSLPQGRQEQTLDVDNLFDAFIGMDAEGLVNAWNLRAEHTFGWSRVEAMGRPVQQLIVPQRNHQRFEQALQQLSLSDEYSSQKFRTTITARHREGNEFEMEAVFFPMPSGERCSAGLVGRALNQPILSEAEAEKQRHAFMDQLGECYVESDLRGRITFVNKTYCATYGVSPEDRLGGNYKTFFPEALATFFREAYKKVYLTGETAKLDYSMTLRNGKQVFNEQSISLRRDAQFNPVGFMVIIRDCFDRKQNELELVKARQAAEAASKAKGEFLANMSHEIRTPLNGVIGMLELARDANSSLEQREFLAMAQSAADSLLSVINDVLDFSKIEAGRLELERTEFDFFEVVAQTVGIMSMSARKKGLRLISDLAPDVPRFLLGDPIRLQQVLLNLLGNAIKFTRDGQVSVSVHAETMRDGRAELKFSVADSGIGIPPEKQKDIFEAFSQADASTTRKFGGTGLGLAISSSIVHAMGGKIWVESQVGKGSTFHFKSILELASSGARKIVEPAVVDHAAAPHHPLHILLAEDSLINQKVAVCLLQKLGHRVVVAGTGVEALARMDEQSFDIAFMDVQMPEMDGFTATAAIRTKEAGTSARLPVVAMTAHAMKGDRERCLQAGMDDYVTKPISMNSIKAAIERVMKS